MTKEEILKRVKKFQGANREFSQELPPIIEGLVDLIDEAGPEVVDSLESNDPNKALSANMGKELNVSKMDAPSVTGEAGQILQLDEEGNPEWVEAAAVGATYDSAVSDTSTNAIQNKTIKKYVDDNFAQKDGYYGSLTAGAAENIVGQSAIEGTFLFRTTAGDADISNGVATVEAVKGNSVAWNQLVQNGDFSDGMTGWSSGTGTTITINSDGSIRVTNNAEGNGNFDLRRFFAIPSGHKVYLTGEFRSSSNTIINPQVNNNASQSISLSASVKTRVSLITTATGSSTTQRIFYVPAGGDRSLGAYIDVFWVNFIDLTLMFGAGNEPATVAAFESWLAANVGSKPYFPASSKLLPTKLLKYVSRGFNQWDEEWEVGAIDYTTGADAVDANTIRSKNYTPIIPDTAYYFPVLGTYLRVAFYSPEKAFISGQRAVGGIITTPSGAGYFRISPESYGPTYKNDICVNLSWDGSRDGEYEPYVEYEYNLDITKFYGKLNGEGDLTQIFPGGMRKADYAGTVRDLLSLKDAEADVKVGNVDLGTVDWVYDSTYQYFRVYQETVNSVNFILAKHVNNGKNESVAEMLTAPDKSAYYRSANNRLLIKDTAYTDTATFKAAMAGVYLDYELATPLHYTELVYRDNGVDTPVEALNVIVNNWSTEEEIIAEPEESGDPNSCAATLDILYGIDAAEQLDTINQSGIFTDDLKANLEALIGVINTNCAGALGGTLSISDAPTDKVYTFTFTPTTEGE